MVSPTAVQKYGEDFGRNPVGTGPWKFKEWVSAESITLEPNLDYRNFRSDLANKGAPLLDSLTYRFISEPETQALAFETGEANVFWAPARKAKDYQENSDYQVFVANDGTNDLYIEFAMEEIPDGEFGAKFKAPFDDIRVRQAVGAALDIDQMLDKVLLGFAQRNYGPMPTGEWAYKPEIEEFGFHYDPEKAKALLDEAGWVDADGDGVREKDGKKLEVLFWQPWIDSDNEKCAQILQNQLNQVGFSVTIQMPENGFSQLGENIHDFNFTSFSLPEPDVIRVITDYDHCLGRYKAEEYQNLVGEALKTTDRAERTAIYFEAQKKMLADAAMIPFWTPLRITAVRPEVKNYKMGKIYNNGLYEDVSIED
jgi:peptide/nickel transport system substrate-binding protein